MFCEGIGGVGINLSISALRGLQQRSLNMQIFMQVGRPAESVVVTDLVAWRSHWPVMMEVRAGF